MVLYHNTGNPRIFMRILVDASVLYWGNIMPNKLYLSIYL